MIQFRVVIDSREQLPFGFVCPTVCRALDAGDYSVDGIEDQVAVERKSLSDFAKTIVHDRERFERELAKLERYEAACIVVEADLDRVLRGGCAAELHGVYPTSVLGAALQITLKHRVPVFWCGSRQAASVFAETYLRMFVRLRAEGLP